MPSPSISGGLQRNQQDLGGSFGLLAVLVAIQLVRIAGKVFKHLAPIFGLGHLVKGHALVFGMTLGRQRAEDGFGFFQSQRARRREHDIAL
jgi:hypothetical protein